MKLYLPNGEEYTVRESQQELRELAPGGEVEDIIREATQQVEDMLRLEDQGWINYSAGAGGILPDAERIANLKLSRLYYLKDPLGKQSIRLWTDYTFGVGMSAHAKEDKTEEVRKAFWDSKENQSVLSPRGQRKSSDKLLVDGEVFFAIFLGPKGKTKIRRIDPLEISEIITDPDDIEDVKYYRRTWVDRQNGQQDKYYRSTTNIKDEPAKDIYGNLIKSTEEALVYHLTNNTLTLRGNPLLLPALDWIKQYRRFLASRIAIMLALARFAWRTKVKGGQTAVDAIKAITDGQEINAGSQLLENLGSDTTPIKTDTGARNAYTDGRMIKLQVSAAVGWPEQYFGDISIGNLATAKTVELPVFKMIQSYQAIWDGAYQDIDEVVFGHNGIAEDKQYVDRDFPEISGDGVGEVAKAIMDTVATFPEFAGLSDVQQVALINIGIDDPTEVLDALTQEAKGNPSIALSRELKRYREVVRNNGNH